MFSSELSKKSLPYIEYIRFDLSGTIHNESEHPGWVKYPYPIEIQSDEDFTDHTSKIFTRIVGAVDEESEPWEKILKTAENSGIDIRVYGHVSGAEDYPDKNKRAIVFHDLSFDEWIAPVIPEYYEINDISEFSSLKDMSVNLINHDEPKPWTLLYINGRFQTNASESYLSSGTRSYDLNGIETTNDTGYKWVVFKLPMYSIYYNIYVRIVYSTSTLRTHELSLFNYTIYRQEVSI